MLRLYIHYLFELVNDNSKYSVWVFKSNLYTDDRGCVFETCAGPAVDLNNNGEIWRLVVRWKTYREWRSKEE
jgi:hypothetical protein